MRILSYLKKASGRGLIFRKLGHLDVNGYTDADWADNITDIRSTSGYFTFIGGITHRVCELLWLRILFSEIGFPPKKVMELYCDNQAAREIANNPVQHDITKHVELDMHYIKEKLVDKLINIPFVKSEEQLVDVLRHAISAKVFHDSLDKLGIGDNDIPT
ncbi:hypothetical protein L3X38_033607 [Prunus dulcis]|uniref:Uncharacterized protein n=1 Tax=Prunus dulcis TaxID=3755 RepID=A0AAD4YX40_PRUDU|nr:hypothetical protein L3X38_033607 [Prunus dulcis]